MFRPPYLFFFFFFNDTATTEIYTLSLHDALPICGDFAGVVEAVGKNVTNFKPGDEVFGAKNGAVADYICVNADRGVVMKPRSEEHTSELQSRLHLVCRLLLEKKKKKKHKSL